METELPEFLKPCFWSYDFSKIGREDKNLVITQVLNWGGERGWKWVVSSYTPEEVRQVVSHPARGMWERDTLRRILAYLGTMIDPLDFDVAIKDLDPKVKIWDAFWERKEKDGLVPRYFE